MRRALWVLGSAIVGVALIAGAGLGFAAHRRWRFRRRMALCAPFIAESAARHGVSPFLVKAVIWRESRFDPLARGRHGESGLMQIRSGAVDDWHRITGNRLPRRGLLFDVRLNIEIGTWYLSHTTGRWGDYRDGALLGLAQYNAGIVKAKEWAPADPAAPLDLHSISYPGTREYITSIQEQRKRFEEEHRDRGQN